MGDRPPSVEKAISIASVRTVDNFPFGSIIAASRGPSASAFSRPDWGGVGVTAACCGEGCGILLGGGGAMNLV